MNMLTEEEIIAECKRFNKTAQTALYKRYAGKMNAVCYRYVGSYEEAKDLVQDGFIKIFSIITHYKGDGSFEGWIKRIIVNMTLDYLRKTKGRKFMSIDTLEQSDEATDYAEEIYVEDHIAEAGYTMEELTEMINLLPDMYRVTFNMYCLEEYSHKEIAQALNIKEETSRSRLRMARIMLKEELAKAEKVRTKHIQFPRPFEAS